MKQPFEGLFGDTCETRLMQFLLPMYGIEFDMADLTDEVRLTRQSISKAMKKFSDRGMVKIRKEGRTWLYSINEQSPLVKRLEDFDNSLIEAMVGPDNFAGIQKNDDKPVHSSHRKERGRRTENASLRYHATPEEVPCIASSSGTYLDKRSRVGIHEPVKGAAPAKGRKK
ncbi:MAG: hypothetical protein ABSB80_05175 [Methanoregula sp.]|jgi:DNA-binding transcriptional ArsR family regulator|uniref:hypothetical protein n=1 Tax=Methanoregula sp. TaxID=2052170 RepID=UPI003D13EFA4